MTTWPTAGRRSVDVAALAARLAAKAADTANPPARRRRNGHIADCPNPARPVDKCRVCRSEVVGRVGDGDEPDDR
jgi:hypothetical protein